MKKLLSIAMLLVGINECCFLVRAADRQSDSDFSLGVKVGICFGSPCEAFHGYIETEPLRNQPVIVRMDELWFGSDRLVDKIAVPYQSLDDARCSGDGGCPVATAWSDAKVSIGHEVAVLFGLGRGFEVSPQEPFLVVSDAHQIAIVKYLGEQARLLTTPVSILDAVTSLKGAGDYVLAGFIYGRLAFSMSSQDVDDRAKLLAQLIGHASVPRDRWDDALTWLFALNGGMSQSSRDIVVSRFESLTQATDEQLKIIGFAGLAELAKRFPSVTIKLGPSERESLARAYRGLVATGDISRRSALEKLLGIGR